MTNQSAGPVFVPSTLGAVERRSASLISRFVAPVRAVGQRTVGFVDRIIGSHLWSLDGAMSGRAARAAGGPLPLPVPWYELDAPVQSRAARVTLPSSSAAAATTTARSAPVLPVLEATRPLVETSAPVTPSITGRDLLRDVAETLPGASPSPTMEMGRPATVMAVIPPEAPPSTRVAPSTAPTTPIESLRAATPAMSAASPATAYVPPPVATATAPQAMAMAVAAEPTAASPASMVASADVVVSTAAGIAVPASGPAAPIASSASMSPRGGVEAATATTSALAAHDSPVIAPAAPVATVPVPAVQDAPALRVTATYDDIGAQAAAATPVADVRAGQFVSEIGRVATATAPSSLPAILRTQGGVALGPAPALVGAPPPAAPMARPLAHAGWVDGWLARLAANARAAHATVGTASALMTRDSAPLGLPVVTPSFGFASADAAAEFTSGQSPSGQSPHSVASVVAGMAAPATPTEFVSRRADHAPAQIVIAPAPESQRPSPIGSPQATPSHAEAVVSAEHVSASAPRLAAAAAGSTSAVSFSPAPTSAPAAADTPATPSAPRATTGAVHAAAAAEHISDSVIASQGPSVQATHVAPVGMVPSAGTEPPVTPLAAAAFERVAPGVANATATPPDINAVAAPSAFVAGMPVTPAASTGAAAFAMPALRFGATLWESSALGTTAAPGAVRAAMSPSGLSAGPIVIGTGRAAFDVVNFVERLVGTQTARDARVLPLESGAFEFVRPSFEARPMSTSDGFASAATPFSQTVPMGAPMPVAAAVQRAPSATVNSSNEAPLAAPSIVAPSGAQMQSRSTTAPTVLEGGQPSVRPSAIAGLVPPPAATSLPPGMTRVEAGLSVLPAATSDPAISSSSVLRPGGIGARTEQAASRIGIRAAGMSLDFVDPAQLENLVEARAVLERTFVTLPGAAWSASFGAARSALPSQVSSGFVQTMVVPPAPSSPGASFAGTAADRPSVAPHASFTQPSYRTDAASSFASPTAPTTAGSTVGSGERFGATGAPIRGADAHLRGGDAHLRGADVHLRGADTYLGAADAGTAPFVGAGIERMPLVTSGAGGMAPAALRTAQAALSRHAQEIWAIASLFPSAAPALLATAEWSRVFPMVADAGVAPPAAAEHPSASPAATGATVTRAAMGGPAALQFAERITAPARSALPSRTTTTDSPGTQARVASEFAGTLVAPEATSAARPMLLDGRLPRGSFTWSRAAEFSAHFGDFTLPVNAVAATAGGESVAAGQPAWEGMPQVATPSVREAFAATATESAAPGISTMMRAATGRPLTVLAGGGTAHRSGTDAPAAMKSLVAPVEGSSRARRAGTPSSVPNFSDEGPLAAVSGSEAIAPLLRALVTGAGPTAPTTSASSSSEGSGWAASVSAPAPIVPAAPASDASARMIEALRTQQSSSSDDRITLADLTLVAVASATQQMAASASNPSGGASRASGGSGGGHGNKEQASQDPESERRYVDELAREVLDEIRQQFRLAHERSGQTWER